jgi:hypothetical protein
MNIRDLFAFDDEEQRQRVDGPSIREIAVTESEPYPGQVSELEAFFVTGLPGDDTSQHPDLPAFNPYLFVPPSELAFLLKHNKDLSDESRERIASALRRIGGS